MTVREWFRIARGARWRRESWPPSIDSQEVVDKIASLVVTSHLPPRTLSPMFRTLHLSAFEWESRKSMNELIRRILKGIQ